MSKLIWHTEKRKINDLVPFDQNPRKLNTNQEKQLMKSLQKFDLVEIPAIDIDNKIIAGHQRLKILQQLGRGDEEIDVRVPNRKLTEAEFREYLLRSNHNAGEWDFDLLRAFDEDLLLDVGFGEDELKELKGGVEEKLEQKEEEIKAYKKIHILISVDLQKIINAESHLKILLENLSKTDGVEIEQSAN